MSRKILFLTGTRADFGKLKSLIEVTTKSSEFEAYIFATGMHLSTIHGYTVEEIEKCGYKNIEKFINHTEECSMDQILAKTIQGFSAFVQKLKPDLIIIHGDRVEALAGAITGALNNVLVAHIEGGEISGTIDELIRHAVSKMSHIHFVANEIAKKRLIQMGELNENIFVIGSPDIDAMLSPNLPSLADVKKRYEINFSSYAIVMFHPVTTEVEHMSAYAKQFVDALLEQDNNMVVIFPNNDLGYNFIIDEYTRLKEKSNIKIFPSIRFEYFIVLLKYAQYIIGNSSAGIREAPYYGVPTINIGTRQKNRALSNEIINCGYDSNDISSAITFAKNGTFNKIDLFGDGNSDKLFIEIIKKESFWSIQKQKQFNEVDLTNA
ncbi:MAG: UDP-N-acetylglucosamine 2-epimerase (hydrolyzing) [Bacteroidia bacterium]|nr:UDP-N-acetylglucosamine 2-epimerase (hydrolyzing) [Bacteroidia bacterium]